MPTVAKIGKGLLGIFQQDAAMDWNKQANQAGDT
jgi:hypothetical protein